MLTARAQLAALVTSSHRRCGASSPAAPVCSNTALMSSWWRGTILRTASRVVLVLSPTGFDSNGSYTFRTPALSLGVSPLLHSLTHTVSKRDSNECRWLSPNTGVQRDRSSVPTACELHLVGYGGGDGNPAQLGREAVRVLANFGVVSDRHLAEAFNEKWAITCDSAWPSLGATMTIRSILRHDLCMDSSKVLSEEILHPVTLLVPGVGKLRRLDAKVEISFNMTVPDEALMVLVNYSSCTCTYHLFDVQHTHESKGIAFVSTTTTNLQYRPDFSLIMRRTSGDVVFIAKTDRRLSYRYQSNVFRVEVATGNFKRIRERCTALTQLSSSVFCVWSLNDLTYELWDCNNTDRPLVVVPQNDGGCTQVVGGRRFLFGVTRNGEIAVIDPSSGLIVLTLGDLPANPPFEILLRDSFL
ncbi:hypothetical protein Pelo_11016 [Pelomyxa schiedti]|nr:hypothetical protein Pelo_11016 [Pelomyxa schiedti]